MPILTIVRALLAVIYGLLSPGYQTVNDNQRHSASLLRSPVLWGGVAYAIFHGLWSQGVITNAFIVRYCFQHPVEYAETGMFLIGAAALILKWLDVRAQRKALNGSLLPKPAAGGVPFTEALPLLGILDRLPSWRQSHIYVGRLRGGLLHVHRAESAERLDEELKYLGEEDANRASDSYGLSRLTIWAIPILGFLGTVIGIGLAMGKLSPQALETSLPEVMSGLMIAFDTTAYALSMSMILFIGQFALGRYEQGLLDDVNSQSAEELLGRFERIPDTPDGQLAAVRKSLEAMLQSHEHTVMHQIDTWQGSLQSVTRQWREIQESLHESGVAAAMLQQGMARQAETLNRAVEATGTIANLESQLNRNLAALAGSKNFEQTVMSLAAAIHLLNARLGDDRSAMAPVTLQPHTRKGHAA